MSKQRLFDSSAEGTRFDTPVHIATSAGLCVKGLTHASVPEEYTFDSCDWQRDKLQQLVVHRKGASAAKWAAATITFRAALNNWRRSKTFEAWAAPVKAAMIRAATADDGMASISDVPFQAVIQDAVFSESFLSGVNAQLRTHARAHQHTTCPHLHPSRDNLTKTWLVLKVEDIIGPPQVKPTKKSARSHQSVRTRGSGRTSTSSLQSRSSQLPSFKRCRQAGFPLDASCPDVGTQAMESAAKRPRRAFQAIDTNRYRHRPELQASVKAVRAENAKLHRNADTLAARASKALASAAEQTLTELSLPIHGATMANAHARDGTSVHTGGARACAGNGLRRPARDHEAGASGGGQPAENASGDHDTPGPHEPRMLAASGTAGLGLGATSSKPAWRRATVRGPGAPNTTLKAASTGVHVASSTNTRRAVDAQACPLEERDQCHTSTSELQQVKQQLHAVQCEVADMTAQVRLLVQLQKHDFID